MKVAGTGSITTIGQRILNYCSLNTIAFSFKYFYITSYHSGVTLETLVDSSYFDNKTYYDLFEAFNVASAPSTQGNITGGTDILSPVGSPYTIIPLLLKVPANAIPYDIDIYTVWLTCEDKTGNRLTLASTTGFAVGNTINNGNGTTAEVISIDSSNNYLYVTNKNVGSLDFAIGQTISNGGAGSSVIQTSGVNTSDVVFYHGCLAYDELLKISVTNAVPFSATSPNNWISSEGNIAQGLISSINGNILTVSRQTLGDFSNLNNVDNVQNYVAAEAQITNIEVDRVNSTLLPISYISDGADFLLRLNLRYSSGFPRDLNFISTQIVEISQHNLNSEAHPSILSAIDDINDELDSWLYTSSTTYTITNDTEFYAMKALLYRGFIIGNDSTVRFQLDSTYIPAVLYLAINNIHGGEVIIQGYNGNFNLTGYIKIKDCTARINFQNITNIYRIFSGREGLYIENCSHISFTNCTGGSGAGYDTFAKIINSTVDIGTGCEFSVTDCTNFIEASLGSKVYFTDVSDMTMRDVAGAITYMIYCHDNSTFYVNAYPFTNCNNSQHVYMESGIYPNIKGFYEFTLTDTNYELLHGVNGIFNTSKEFKSGLNINLNVSYSVLYPVNFINKIINGILNITGTCYTLMLDNIQASNGIVTSDASIYFLRIAGCKNVEVYDSCTIGPTSSIVDTTFVMEISNSEVKIDYTTFRNWNTYAIFSRRSNITIGTFCSFVSADNRWLKIEEGSIVFMNEPMTTGKTAFIYDSMFIYDNQLYLTTYTCP